MTTSSDSRWSAFSAADIEKRWSRAREAMDERGLDALLVSGEENFQYFTGSTGTLAYPLLLHPARGARLSPRG